MVKYGICVVMVWCLCGVVVSYVISFAEFVSCLLAVVYTWCSWLLLVVFGFADCWLWWV